jgi:hypothetical protein
MYITIAPFYTHQFGLFNLYWFWNVLHMLDRGLTEPELEIQEGRVVHKHQVA